MATDDDRQSDSLDTPLIADDHFWVAGVDAGTSRVDASDEKRRFHSLQQGIDHMALGTQCSAILIMRVPFLDA